MRSEDPRRFQKLLFKSYSLSSRRCVHIGSTALFSVCCWIRCRKQNTKLKYKNTSEMRENAIRSDLTQSL
jgi:hypothetical protein